MEDRTIFESCFPTELVRHGFSPKTLVVESMTWSDPIIIRCLNFVLLKQTSINTYTKLHETKYVRMSWNWICVLAFRQSDYITCIFLLCIMCNLSVYKCIDKAIHKDRVHYISVFAFHSENRYVANYLKNNIELDGFIFTLRIALHLTHSETTCS